MAMRPQQFMTDDDGQSTDCQSAQRPLERSDRLAVRRFHRLQEYRLLIRIAFWASLVLTLTMAWLPKPPEALDDIGDKYQHMLAFGTLTVLACAAYPRSSLIRIGGWLGLVGMLIEMVQAVPVLHRDCDVMDWIVEAVVIVAVLIVVRAVRRR
jgi:hypothetical protein